MIDFTKLKRRYRNPCTDCTKPEKDKMRNTCRDHCGKWKAYDFCVWRDIKIAKKYVMGEVAEALHKRRVRQKYLKK